MKKEDKQKLDYFSGIRDFAEKASSAFVIISLSIIVAHSQGIIESNFLSLPILAGSLVTGLSAIIYGRKYNRLYKKVSTEFIDRGKIIDDIKQIIAENLKVRKNEVSKHANLNKAATDLQKAKILKDIKVKYGISADKNNPRKPIHVSDVMRKAIAKSR